MRGVDSELQIGKGPQVARFGNVSGLTGSIIDLDILASADSPTEMFTYHQSVGGNNEWQICSLGKLIRIPNHLLCLLYRLVGSDSVRLAVDSVCGNDIDVVGSDA